MSFRIRILAVAFLVLVGSVAGLQAAPACGQPDQHDYFLAPGFFVHDYCLVSPRHWDLNFYRDFAAQNPDLTVNTVVEIPAGTNDKFEVNEDTGKMCWELKNGVPRVIKYLGYPGNYGMVPRTVGGDGDSLDMLTLGRFERRGKVLAAKVIGVVYLDDDGETDDKLIGVLPGTDFYAYDNLSDLEVDYKGITSIIGTWFANYKGPDALTVLGFGDADKAQLVLDAAMQAYQ